GGGALADDGAVNPGFTMQQLEATRRPVGDLRAEQQAGVVAEIAGDHRGPVVVDLLQRAARDLDAGVHGFHEAPRGFGRPVDHVDRRVLRNLEDEFRFDGGETAREHRRLGATAAVGTPQAAAEDGPDQPLRAKLLAQRFGNPADLPAGYGVVPEGNRLVLAAISGIQVGRHRPRITVERAGRAPRFYEFSGDSPRVEGAIGD